MAVDIIGLLENSHDTFSLVDLDVAFAQSNCHKYKITYSHPCTIEGVGSTPDMYLDAQFLAPEYENVKESLANRDGTNKKLFHRLTPVLRLEFVVNDFIFHALQVIGLHEVIMISPINPSGDDYEVDPDSWSVERVGEDTEDTYACRITFKVKDSSLSTKTCCDDQSIVSFEDPCDPEGGGGGGEIVDV